MNKTTFQKNPDVQAFAIWMAERIHILPVNLSIKNSRFVPGGVRAECHGFSEVIERYAWRAEGMETGNWQETGEVIAQLRSELRDAIDHGSNADALAACKKVLKWGGNRNYNKGAYPFLKSQANLRKYLQNTAQVFALDTANTAVLGAIKEMNSMLTKVHAFYADDGLPIYDSRVAAAIATLVELWRADTGRTQQALPSLLKFPALSKARSVHKCFENAKTPGMLVYGQSNIAANWSSSKIRLGWLMQAILLQQPLLHDQPLADQMRTYEAVLFMIGYDVTCIKGNIQTNRPLNVTVAKKQSSNQINRQASPSI